MGVEGVHALRVADVPLGNITMGTNDTPQEFIYLLCTPRRILTAYITAGCSPSHTIPPSPTAYKESNNAPPTALSVAPFSSTLTSLPLNIQIVKSIKLLYPVAAHLAKSPPVEAAVIPHWINAASCPIPPVPSCAFIRHLPFTALSYHPLSFCLVSRIHPAMRTYYFLNCWPQGVVIHLKQQVATGPLHYILRLTQSRNNYRLWQQRLLRGTEFTDVDDRIYMLFIIWK